MRALVVTSADQRFYTLLSGAIASVRANIPPGGVEIAVMDIGLHDWQLAELATKVEHIFKPSWAINFPGQNSASNVLRALVARPFLRDLFPSYEMFLWIDADAWIQDKHAIATYFEAASTGSLAITPEIHRYYQATYQDPRVTRPCEYDIYCRGWGETAAGRMVQSPLANAGVFALRRDSIAWSAWADTLTRILQLTTNFYVEQTALNGAILTGRVPFVPLPAHCNWICHHATPVFDPASGDWFEPGYPRQKLSVIHMTGNTKFTLVDAQTTDRRSIWTSLRYPGSNRYLSDSDYVSPGLKPINLAPCFPRMSRGNPARNDWPYLRRESPHTWYVDDRVPHIGFINCDEAHILFHSALKVAGRRALEIGCFLGWSAAHLLAAGVELDVIDPLLARQDIRFNVECSLFDAGLLSRVNLIGAASPEAVEALVRSKGGNWALVFIDGNHEEPGPYLDAMVCERHCARDALVLFYDLAAPAVARGLEYFRERGWKTMIYSTAQIMGVAWRGNIEPIRHIPDSRGAWSVPAHLSHYSPAKAGTLERVEAKEVSAVNGGQ